MAHYRAIFKQAYIKGIASSVILTAGLTMVANANAGTSLDKDTIKTASGDITITGVADQSGSGNAWTDIKLTLSSGADTSGATTTHGITITGGTLANNYITTSGGNVEATFSGSTLTLNTEDATHGLSIIAAGSGSSGSTLTAKFDNVNVQNGTLLLDISANSSGGAFRVDAGKEAVTLDTTSLSIGSGTLQIGQTATTTGAYTVGNATSGAAITIGNQGSLKVGAGQATTKIVASSLNAEAGSNIEINGATTLENKGAATNSLLFKSGSNTTINNVLTITGSGEATFEAGAVLVGATGTSDNITVNGSGGALTLNIDQGVFNNYINGTATDTESTGKIVLSGSGNLTVTGEMQNALDLAQLEKDQKLTLNSGSTVTAQKLAVNNALSASTTVAAEELTLGSSTFNGEDLKVGTANISKNLILNSSTGTYTATGTVINFDLGGQSGSISGAYLALADKDLTVKNGYLVAEEGVGLTASGSGSIAVGSGSAATFVVNKTFTLGAKDVNISGTATELATLDLTNATVAFADPTVANNSGSIVVSGSGLLKINSSDLNSILDATKTATKLDIKAGTVQAIGDLNIGSDALVSGAAANKISFSGASTLDVNGKLNVTGTTLALVEGSTLKANSLNLDFADVASGSLTSGNFIVRGDLTSNSATNVLNIGDKATLTLGEITTDANGYNVGSNGGNIMDLDVTSASGSVLFTAGTWNAGNLTASSGSIYIGDINNIKYDAKGNLINSNVNATHVTSKLNGGVVVNNGHSLTTNTIETLSGSSINLTGDLTINGKYSLTGESKDGENTATYGLNLAQDTINVQNNGVLTFGETASQAFRVDGDTFTILDSKLATNGAINLSKGGKIAFTWDDSYVFNKTSLNSLRAQLLGIENGAVSQGRIDIGDARIAGLEVDKNNEIQWGVLESFVDVMTDYEQNDLKQATVTNITTSSQVTGNYGSLSSNEITAQGYINIANDTSLHNAAGNTRGEGLFGVGKDGAVVGLNVSDGSQLELLNGGIAGKVKLANNSILKVTNGTTEIQGGVDGSNGKIELVSSNTSITGDANVASFTTDADSNLNVKGTLTANSNLVASNFKGNVNVGSHATFNNDVHFGANTEVGGHFTALDGQSQFDGNALLKGKVNVKDVSFNGQSNVVEGEFTATDFAGFYGNTQLNDASYITGSAEIAKNAQVNATTISLGAISTPNTQTVLAVGKDAHIDPTTGQRVKGSTGYLQANQVSLNGNILIVDPDWDQATSVAAIHKFAEQAPGVATKEGGVLDGNLILAQNSALTVGKDVNVEGMQNYISQYQYGNSLQQNGVGAVMYINSQIDVADNARIIIDPSRSKTQILTENGDKGGYGELNAPDSVYNKISYQPLATDNNGKPKAQVVQGEYSADLYLGTGAVLSLSENATSSKTSGAIHFEKADAAIYGAQGSKIVLDGENFNSRYITLFTDQGLAGEAPNHGVKILGEQDKNDILVESANGLMYFYLEAGTETTGGTLKLNTYKLNTAYNQASEPMRDYLIAYASNVNNYLDYFYSLDNTDPNAPIVTPDYMLGNEVDHNLVNIDVNGNITLAENNPVHLDVNDMVAVKQADGSYKAYFKAYNSFLERVVTKEQGLSADQAARMSEFGGAARVALAANSTTTEAISSRMGMGLSNATLSYANNGQGTALWLAPIYKTSEASGFGAQGLSYGNDIDIFGLALGADYTLANGLRIGAAFNIGSADVDGTGAANVVKNDASYYGFALYTGYNFNNLSVVADLDYTVVDNDLTANTYADKLSATTDSTALSLGVTAQYNLDFGGVSVAPHAGLRFTRIDTDDYNINGSEQVGNYSAGSANVFSIPVGVTFAKEFKGEYWSIKPSLDLTLTGNFGDDTVDGTTHFAGVNSRDVGTSTEFVDSFTYGVATGVAATNGNFSFGVGLNYTGSSNVDEYGLSANARYVF